MTEKETSKLPEPSEKIVMHRSKDGSIKDYPNWYTPIYDSVVEMLGFVDPNGKKLNAKRVSRVD